MTIVFVLLSSLILSLFLTLNFSFTSFNAVFLLKFHLNKPAKILVSIQVLLLTSCAILGKLFNFFKP